MFTAILALLVAPILSSAIKTHGNFQPMNGYTTNIDGNRWYTKSGPSTTFVNKRNIPSVRQGKAYEDDVIPGGDVAADQESVDLHKGEFCVDVSTFGPVQYDIAPVEVCDSTFSKKCEDRYETVTQNDNYCCSILNLPMEQTMHMISFIVLLKLNILY